MARRSQTSAPKRACNVCGTTEDALRRRAGGPQRLKAAEPIVIPPNPAAAAAGKLHGLQRGLLCPADFLRTR